MAIVLKEVAGSGDLKKFVKFPFSIYKNHKYWIPPLINGELNTLRPDKNPSLENCEWKYVLAYRNGKIVGRIAGIINKRFNERWERKYARFCWFDFIDDREVSATLLADIEKWALSKGMDRLLGPMGFSTFERQGMLLEGFDNLPTFSSAYNHEYYPQHLIDLGYLKDIDYVEYVVKTPSEIPEKAQKIRDLIIQRYQLTTLEGKTRKEILPYARKVFQVVNDAYRPLFGFVELTEKQIDYFVNKYFSFIDPAYVTAVIDKDDNVAGFQISVPSLSRAFQKARGRLFPFGFFHIMKAMRKPNKIDIMLVAVHPDYQNKGVNAIFMTDLTRICIERGVEYAESNGEMEENQRVQNFWRYYDAKKYKRNRVFYKDLKKD